MPPPPKLEAPPPPFIPPPEIQIATPPPAPTITATTPTPPPAPVTIAPAPPPVAVAGAAGAAGARSGSAWSARTCATVLGDSSFPVEAQRKGIEKRRGDDGVDRDGDRRDQGREGASARPIRSSPGTALALISAYKCVGPGPRCRGSASLRLQARMTGASRAVAPASEPVFYPSIERTTMRHINSIPARLTTLAGAGRLLCLSPSRLWPRVRRRRRRRDAPLPPHRRAAPRPLPTRRAGADVDRAHHQGDGRQPLRPQRPVDAGRLRRPRHAHHPGAS